MEERGPAARRRSLALAREIASRLLTDWLAEVEPVAENMYRRAVARFVDLANEFFRRLAASSGQSAPPETMEPETSLRAPRRFFFNDLFELAPASALAWMSDLAGGESSRRAAAGYLRVLLEHNTTRVVNDLDERVAESRRHLEAEIRDRLRAGLDSATRALSEARSFSAAGSGAVAGRLSRLDTLTARLDDLLTLSGA